MWYKINKIRVGTQQVRPDTWTPWPNTLWYWTFDDMNANQITDVSWNWNNITGGVMPTYTQVLWGNYAWNYNNVSSWDTQGYHWTIDSNKFTVNNNGLLKEKLMKEEVRKDQ